MPRWLKKEIHAPEVRGIYAEGNPAVAATFNPWPVPFARMGADAVVSSRTTGTDHVFVHSAGLPGFQFIRDPLDYESRTHRSDVDIFAHLKAADLHEASVTMASFLWNAADADAPQPRLPWPTRPNETNPFAYVDEDE